jgi:hypothetical protein
MNNKFMKVLHVAAPTKDSGGVFFKTVTLQGVQLIGGKEVLTKGTVVRNFWPARYEREIGGVKTEIRGDAEYDTIEPGMLYAGEVFQCPTTDYTINNGNNVINTWRGVVFEGENPLIVAARALRQNGAKPKYQNESTGEWLVFELPQNQPANKVADPIP